MASSIAGIFDYRQRFVAFGRAGLTHQLSPGLRPWSVLLQLLEAEQWELEAVASVCSLEKSMSHNRIFY